MKALMRRFNQWMKGPYFAWIVCIICCGFAVYSFYAAVWTDPQPQGSFFETEKDEKHPYIELVGELHARGSSPQPQKIRIALPSAAQGEKSNAVGGAEQQAPLNDVRSFFIRSRACASKWWKSCLTAHTKLRIAWERDRRAAYAWLRNVVSAFGRSWRRYQPQSATEPEVRPRLIPDTHTSQLAAPPEKVEVVSHEPGKRPTYRQSTSEPIQYAESVQAVRQGGKNLLHLMIVPIPPWP